MNDTNKYMNKVIRTRNSKIDLGNVIFRWKNGRVIPIKTNEYTLYHSSPADFNEFDDKYIESNSLGGLAFGRGHYFLPVEAYVYGKNHYKVKVNFKKPFIVDEHDWSNELTKLGYNWYSVSRQDPSDFLASKGYDGTIIKNGYGISEVIVYSNKDKKIKIVNKE